MCKRAISIMNEDSIKIEEQLLSISPLDGRYSTKCEELQGIFSEYSLIKCRLHIEVEYLVFILEKILNLKISLSTREFLNKLCVDFNIRDAMQIKDIEKTTNHDVKAVEYYLKEKIKGKPIEKYSEYIHFGLTSQDINSVSYIVQIKHFVNGVFINNIDTLLQDLNKLIDDTKSVSMIARTHGQTASPTTMGKEMMVFSYKLKMQMDMLRKTEYYTKFGGATGNMNAHYAAFPSVEWEMLLNDFIISMGFTRHMYTTQIDNYEMYAVIFDNVRRIQTVLVDMCQDIWTYISMDYFKLRKLDGEIGSSTMPHKVNPIDFENAEGNFLMSNTILQFLSNKLPVSRLQRDLTDSTVLRNMGVAFGYGLVAIKSLVKGLGKLEINHSKIEQDLNENWTVVMEGIQTILRRELYPNAYEVTKEFLKEHRNPDKETIRDFIGSLDVDEHVQTELMNLTPQTYIGILAKF